MIENNQRSKIFSTPIVAIPYLFSAIMLSLEYFIGNKDLIFGNSVYLVYNFVFLYISIFFLFFWDLTYYFDSCTTVGRSAESVNGSTHIARQQISYFLPFYGIIFGYYFTAENFSQENFIKLVIQANVPFNLLLVPFFISCIGLLFMPVQTSILDPPNQESQPSKGQKLILVLTSLAQQSAILILAHTVLRIFNQWSINNSCV